MMTEFKRTHRGFPLVSGIFRWQKAGTVGTEQTVLTGLTLKP